MTTRPRMRRTYCISFLIPFSPLQPLFAIASFSTRYVQLKPDMHMYARNERERICIRAQQRQNALCTILHHRCNFQSCISS